ncbi:hypothetical protein DRQ53_09495 [bacterium]|nr:MAG: hypothetical protein DRQ53_09495 [bacterium]
MLRAYLIVLLTVGLAITATGAYAEYDRPAGSLTAAFHLGVGWGNATVDDSGGTVADSGALTGAMWGFRINRALSNIVTFGIDYVGYASVEDNPEIFDRIESQFWVIGPSLSWYPAAGGFFLKGLVGWGGVDFRVEQDDVAARTNEDGMGLAGSIGYERPISVSLSLGAQLDYVWMNVNEVLVSDGIGGREEADFLFQTWGLNVFIMFNY